MVPWLNELLRYQDLKETVIPSHFYWAGLIGQSLVGQCKRSLNYSSGAVFSGWQASYALSLIADKGCDTKQSSGSLKINAVRVFLCCASLFS